MNQFLERLNPFRRCVEFSKENLGSFHAHSRFGMIYQVLYRDPNGYVHEVPADRLMDCIKAEHWWEIKRIINEA